jgi:hypothetical protein
MEVAKEVRSSDCLTIVRKLVKTTHVNIKLIYCISAFCCILDRTREDSTTVYTTKVYGLKRLKWPPKRMKEINNKNNDIPKGTEDKVYSTVVSPIISIA